MVLVIDKHKKPCNTISNAYARVLLFKKQAVIHKRFPFTIRLKNDNAVLKDKSYTVKLDPGSKTTGIAITDDKDSVIMLAELEHIGHLIKKDLNSRRIVRKSRRQRKTRYRPARFLNRTKPKGSKLVEGFQTGDMVKAVVPKGLNKGKHLGRVIIKSSGYFEIKSKNSSVQGINHKYCHLIQKGDGYLYNYKESDFLSAIAKRVMICLH